MSPSSPEPDSPCRGGARPLASVPAPKPAPRRTRRPIAATRELMLRAGAELVLVRVTDGDASTNSPLAFVRFPDVAATASRIEGRPVTTGAIYQLWPNQTAFQLDLARRILEQATFPQDAAFEAAFAAAEATGATPDELLDRVVDAAFDAYRSSPWVVAAAGVRSLALTPDGAALIQEATARFIEGSREAYARILGVLGLRVRPPLTLDDLIRIVGALHDGLVWDLSVDPSADPRPGGGRSLVAIATRAIVDRFCEPA